MASTFYTVSISSLTGPNNGGGFINNLTTARYMAIDGSTPGGVSVTKDNARGNIRFNLIVSELGLMANCYLTNIVATGANANTTPTSFSFVLQSEQGDSVLTTPDELNSGVTLLGNAAIQRCIARALIQDRNDPALWYDPTTTTSIGNSNTTTTANARYDQITGLLDTGPLVNTAISLANSISTASNAITVTKIGI